MIQKTSQRQLNAVLPRQSSDAPEEWGQWVRNRHYSLEVSQHPLRARMCGFGDKDRRPLAPAAVAKMIVRREDNSILDVDDIDVDFFLVTVDLWSADAQQEMNLVLHPSSADRYVPAAPKPRKRPAPQPTTPAPPPRRPGPYPTPERRPPSNHAPGPFTLRPIEPTLTPLLPPSYTPSPTPATYFPPDSFPWDRLAGPTLPSIHSLHTSPPTTATDIPTPTTGFPELPFRGWGDGLWEPHTGVGGGGGVPVEPARWADGSFTLPALPETWQPGVQHAFSAFGQSHTQPSQPQPQAQLPPPQPPAQLQPPARDGQHTIPPLPRHTYTRTLVGPLSANAQRLQDEHRKPGIFFLFQDLSIRTEGTFRLRMRLMNVGLPPAPNGLSNAVHTGVSPVLAQVFTEPFTVYSAKRFPGVPDTTALSIAFGNQGQKLPLRNRHGTGKQPRRRRPGTASSDDESS